MYHYTEYHVPKPIRPSKTEFIIQHNSCSSATHSFIIERLERRSSTCDPHLVDAGFPRNIAPVDTVTSFIVTPQYYSSSEAGGSNFLSAMGQVGYAASGGPSRIEPAAFNTCQFIFTIPTIKQYSALLVDGLDPTSRSALSFESALWTHSASLEQRALAHTNYAWIPNTNPIETHATDPVSSSEAQTSAAKSVTGYPVFPEERYRGSSQQPAQQNTAPGTSSRQSGLDFTPPCLSSQET